MKKELFEEMLIKYVVDDKENKEFYERTTQIEEKLKQNLNEEQQRLLLDYTNAHFDYIMRCSVENFKQGFWTGCEMTREMLE